MSKDRVKNEIHCRVKPDVMQYIINQAKLSNCSVSDICRLLIEKGMRFDEDLTDTKASNKNARILQSIGYMDSTKEGYAMVVEIPCREVAEALSTTDSSNEDEYADDENEIEGWG